MESSDNLEGNLQTKEVEEIKAKYGSDCRVIRHIGDFEHVLNIKLNCDLDVHITFQLEASYPTSSANVVVKSKNLQPDDVNAFSSHLQTYAMHNQGKPLVRKVMKAAKKWLEDNPSLLLNDSSQCIKETRSGSNQRSRRKQRQEKQEKQLDDETKDKKLASMKTAIDVVSRIQWDESLNKEDFIVGYLDRMLGVIEKRFTIFSWEDVASVDYNTLAIPKHRIHYFKFKDITVWDKNKRLDDVFGSTGGKTIDIVIEQYNRDHGYPNNDVRVAADIQEESQDSDDDGITIDTGFSYSAAAMEDEQDSDWKPPDNAYWGPKKRPTHFLCLRVTNPDVVAAVAKLHNLILATEPNYEKCIIPPERIHVTLACLGLDTPDDVNKAADALESCKNESWLPHDLQINFNDIGNFFNSVLYAKVEACDTFHKFAENLRMTMVAKEIEIRDVFEFTPHMTIMKLKRQVGREVLHTTYLDQRLYSLLAGSNLGSQAVDNIHLCDMSEDRDQQGFYITPKMIHLN